MKVTTIYIAIFQSAPIIDCPTIIATYSPSIIIFPPLIKWYDFLEVALVAHVPNDIVFGGFEEVVGAVLLFFGNLEGEGKRFDTFSEHTSNTML